MLCVVRSPAVTHHALPGAEGLVADLITREYGLAEAQAALEDVAAQRVAKALIVPRQE